MRNRDKKKSYYEILKPLKIFKRFWKIVQGTTARPTLFTELFHLARLSSLPRMYNILAVPQRAAKKQTNKKTPNPPTVVFQLVTRNANLKVTALCCLSESTD